MDKRKFDVLTLLERPRALFCWPSRVRSHLLRGTEFVVLLNFDNVLEAPRSARRNHYCDIGFSHELDFCGERNADSISLSSSKLTISLILFKSKWLILVVCRTRLM